MHCEVTQADFDAFWNDGYVAFPVITTPEEVVWIREIYDQLFAERRGLEKGDMFDFASANEPGDKPSQVPQLLNPSKYDKRLRKTRFRDNALAVAQRLLGPTAELVFEHAIMKPALNGGVTSWHQDAAFYEKYTNYESVTFWMPLQDVDSSNGCMEFIPGSHKGPLLPHQPIGNDLRVHGLEAIGVDDSLAVPVFVPAGGVSIHHNKTLHYAGPNPSPSPRRAYALGFGVKSRAATVREDLPWNAARKAYMMEGMNITGRMMTHARNAAKSVLRR
jgi:ectoine hydroxylase-related dioxygenase (phytanoyl-CoA dioxygenase family)